ncbi:hypothetical protein IPZ70_28650 [Streptomyces polychromogenes]|nr:hypothetical protein [Streptomyces polychromogenes]
MSSTAQPTTTLWRPTGPVELELVRALDWRAWPPRLPEVPLRGASPRPALPPFPGASPGPRSWGLRPQTLPQLPLGAKRT